MKGFNLTSKQNRNRIFIIVMLLWPIAHFLLFWVFVNGRTILLTFQRPDPYGTVTGTPGKYYFVGLDNYINTFKSFFFATSNGGDRILKNALRNSLSILPLNVCIILPIAYVFAFVLFKKIRLGGFFRVAFYLPSIISLVVLVLMYRYMFNPEFGPIAMLLRKFGVTKDLLDLTTPNKYIWPLIYIFCIWAGMGNNIILISSAMSRVPTEILESAKLDGVGFWRECFQIVLPLVWPTISTLIIIGSMAIFTFTQQPLLFGNTSDQTMTISLYVFNIVNSNSSQYAAVSAATVGLLFCFLFTPVIFFIKWFTERFGRDAEF